MSDTLEKQIAIDAICGARLGMTLASCLEREGLMRFSGNQHNPDWQWQRAKLEAMDPTALRNLYIRVKGLCAVEGGSA